MIAAPNDRCLPAAFGARTMAAMDILAHALWAGIGVAAASRRIAISRRTAVATVAAAVAPDLLQLLPLAAWVAFSDGALSTIAAYSLASPGTEPATPDWVQFSTHHLHCIMHSGIVAAIFTLVAMTIGRGAWVPLLGWWSHIVIDVFTHSAEYYPSPVLYPLSMKGFDGVAWNEPWFMAVNYAALALACGWLFISRTRRGRRNR